MKLPDERFRPNLLSMAERLSTDYGLSFSRAVGERLRKSAWRLFSSGELSLLSTHQRNSFERCRGHKVILAVEDTTSICYRHQSKKGLGRLGGVNAMGLDMHTNMLLSESGESLGICYQHIRARPSADKTRHHNRIPIELKDSYKWFWGLHQLNELWPVSNQGTVIKIADRDSDISELYHHPRGLGIELLTRVRHTERLVFGPDGKVNLSSLVNKENFKGSGKIDLQRKGNAPARTAQANYYSAQISLPKLKSGKEGEVKMNVIWVKETPSSKDAINWVLMTTLPVESFEDILRIVGYYSKRWVIERFHFILKSGMNIEKIQIDDAERLKNALQLYSLIAWHVLKIHRLGEQASQEDATEYFEERSIDILQKVAGQKVITADDFVHQLAKLAGFRPTNQQRHPGEKTLWQAITIFNNIIKGFEAAEKFYETG